MCCVGRYGSVILINVRRSERDMYFDLLKPYIKVPKGQPTVQEYSNLRSDGECGWLVKQHTALGCHTQHCCAQYGGYQHPTV